MSFRRVLLKVVIDFTSPGSPMTWRGCDPGSGVHVLVDGTQIDVFPVPSPLIPACRLFWTGSRMMNERRTIRLHRKGLMFGPKGLVNLTSGKDVTHLDEDEILRLAGLEPGEYLVGK